MDAAYEIYYVNLDGSDDTTQLCVERSTSRLELIDLINLLHSMWDELKIEHIEEIEFVHYEDDVGNIIDDDEWKRYFGEEIR